MTWRVRDSVEEGPTDGAEGAGEWASEEEPADGAAPLCSRGHTRTDEELLRAQEPRKWAPEMDSIPGEDAGKTAEMTTEDLEHSINVADKAAAGFGRTDSRAERSSVGNLVAKTLHPTEKPFGKEKSSHVGNSLLVLRNGHSSVTWSSSSRLHRRPSSETRPSASKNMTC